MGTPQSDVVNLSLGVLRGASEQTLLTALRGLDDQHLDAAAAGLGRVLALHAQVAGERAAAARPTPPNRAAGLSYEGGPFASEETDGGYRA